ncbi:hypothetical protein BTJ40_19255 [Microbulbifer sp. A4B17]|nr:hypothetical protein BTJ40_19255 [Microbulbifer sp. A4B17]
MPLDRPVAEGLAEKCAKGEIIHKTTSAKNALEEMLLLGDRLKCYQADLIDKRSMMNDVLVALLVLSTKCFSLRPLMLRYAIIPILSSQFSGENNEDWNFKNR